jgi:hypothetical protein
MESSTAPSMSRVSFGDNWSEWRSSSPGLIPGRRYHTDELFELSPVSRIVIDLGVVKEGQSVSNRILEDTTDDFQIVGIERFAKLVSATEPDTFYSNISGLEECVTKQTLQGMNEGEYAYTLKVNNNSGKDLHLRYYIKYTDGFVWQE